jgi:MinD-like ATPase involved in chromosome partitioning or flagellar assembly
MAISLPKVIGIVSGKGGVGKTTVAMNLSLAFSQLKLNTLLVDADTRMAGMSIQLDMYNSPLTLNDLLKGNFNVFDAVYIHHSGLKIIPSSFFDEYGSLSLLSFIANKLKPNYDLIFIDSPPGISESTIDILRSCEGIIAVVTPDIASVFGIIKIVKAAKEIGAEPLGIIVNRYNRKVKGQLTEKEISESLDLPVISVIPEDNTIRESINRRVPSLVLDPDSPSSTEFKRIAVKLLEKENVSKTSLLKKVFRF